MNTEIKNNDSCIDKIFYVLIGIVIFFTTSDLVCGFTEQPILATICSVTSAIFVFIGYFKIKRIETEDKIKQLTKFIRGNFDRWQIILSVLDVICSIIVVFTSVMAIGMLFRSIILLKILFTPAKIITISNKFKTVTKPLLIFCFVWLFIRIKHKIKENKMSNIKLSTTQKVVMIVAFVLGITYSVLSATCLPQIAMFDDIITQIATSLSGTAGVVAATFIKGKEMTAEEIAKRDEKIKAKEEAAKAKITAKEENVAAKVEAKKLAKAQAIVDKRRKAAEKKAKANSEKDEIEALADKLEAEQQAKVQNSNN